MMTRVGRHHYQPGEGTDWRGHVVGCQHCPLPADNDIHKVREVDDDARAAQRRRTGERE